MKKESVYMGTLVRSWMDNKRIKNVTFSVTDNCNLMCKYCYFTHKTDKNKMTFDVAKRTVAATKLNDGDSVVNVVSLKEQRNIVLQTTDGYFLRFPVEDIPEKKKAAIGVRGIKLNAKHTVENVYYTKNAVESVMEYKGKTVELNKIKLGSRDSKGVKIRT